MHITFVLLPLLTVSTVLVGSSQARAHLHDIPPMDDYDVVPIGTRVMESFASTGGDMGSSESAEKETRSGELFSTPEYFSSPDHLRSFLKKVNSYYAIAGRPRLVSYIYICAYTCITYSITSYIL